MTAMTDKKTLPGLVVGMFTKFTLASTNLPVVGCIQISLFRAAQLCLLRLKLSRTLRGVRRES